MTKTSGYSGKPLAAKLGLKPGMTFFLKDAPKGFAKTLGPTPDVKVLKAPTNDLDCVLCFVDGPAALKTSLPALKKRIAKNGMLWISWAKKSSPLFNGVTEDHVRGLALDIGLVDVKVCAVDEDWSGLKLVYRLRDR